MASKNAAVIAAQVDEAQMMQVEMARQAHIKLRAKKKMSAVNSRHFLLSFAHATTS